MGERGFLSTIAGFLAQALYAQGEYDEAERFSRASETAASSHDVPSQVSGGARGAKIRARRATPSRPRCWRGKRSPSRRQRTCRSQLLVRSVVSAIWGLVDPGSWPLQTS
jgi:hypothetical protein